MYTLRMLSYDHQGVGGVYITSLANTSLIRYGTCTRCTCCRMIIRGWGGVLTSLASTSLTLRHMYTSRMLSYDHQGVGSVLTSLRSTSLTLRNTLPHKINKCTKIDTLRPTAGHGVTMLPCCSLWLLRCHQRSGTEALRRGKNWKSECRPDMIRTIENHRILMFFLTPEEQNRVAAQANRKFSLLSHTPANRNECPCCKHFLTTPSNTSILSLSLKNQKFKFVALTRAPSQPVAFIFHQSTSFSAQDTMVCFSTSSSGSYQTEKIPAIKLQFSLGISMDFPMLCGI